jgi:trinucleotide repeat-containing gene 6 protein
VENDSSTETTGCLGGKVTRESQNKDSRKIYHHSLLQNIVHRTDLDPHVLSNSGWGWSAIKQNTDWLMEVLSLGEGKAGNGQKPGEAL